MVVDSVVAVVEDGENVEPGEVPSLVAPEPASRMKTAVKVGVRVVVIVVVLVIAAVVLAGIFDDLEPQKIVDALNRLSDAEIISLFMGWLIWIGAQGLQTASLVDGLPARRGVLAYLGPSAVASVIPGPSDLPVRYSMYQSWGTTPQEAGTAVAASGVFSVGSQLALPAFAGVAIAVSGIQVDGFLTVIVVATLILAAVIVAGALVLGSEQRTRWVAGKLDPAMRWVFRLVRKTPPEEDLGSIVVEQRAISFDHLRGKWLPTTGATVLTIGAKCSLLIMALRFVGIPENALGWSAIFAVFALVAGLTIIPITPGSAGVSEIALVGMLAPIAGDAYVNEVAAGVLIYRLLTWILLIPTGLVALGGWKLTQRRQAADAAA
jgi:uncharacterized membrane protein YbhN (UPF0104 family)